MIQNARIVSVATDPFAYHQPQAAERGTAEHFMSASALKLFAECPSRYVRGYNPPDSDAKRYGSALDAQLLTPAIFMDRFAVKPATYRNDKGEVKDWNGNSTVCKGWLADHEGFEIISADELESCNTAIARLREDEVIASVLDNSEKQVHVVAQWHDEPTGLVIPLRALIDIVPSLDLEFGKTIFDLKTTRCAALRAWQHWCFQCGYHMSAALYLDIFSAASGTDRNTMCYILSENFPPYETAKRMLSQDFTTLGRETYQRLLKNYCQCVKNQRWPSYDDVDESVQGFGLVNAEPFMAERAMFAPRFEFGEEQPEEESQPADADISAH